MAYPALSPNDDVNGLIDVRFPILNVFLIYLLQVSNMLILAGITSITLYIAASNLT